MVKDKKESLMKKADSFLKRKGKEFKEWKAKAPERRDERHKNNMIKLEQKLEESKLKKQLMEEKAEIAKQKEKMSEARRKGMEQMPSMFGNIGTNDQDKSKEMPDINKIFGIGSDHKTDDKPPMPKL